MNKQLLKDSIIWGFVLWLIGYILGIILFFVVPQNLIGWIIMPIGVIIISWISLKRVGGDSLRYYFILAIAWTIIAIVLDYFFIVKMLNPADGYYKLDIYIYYALTLAIPLLVGWSKQEQE